MSVVRSEAQRRILRSKASERALGKFLMEHDGPSTKYPPGGGVATTTGRVGHIFRYDVSSLHYTAENKNIRVGSLWKIWKQVVDLAKKNGDHPLLRIDPTNEDARKYPNLHVISESRHAELLECEKRMLSIPADSGKMVSIPTHPQVQ